MDREIIKHYDNGEINIKWQPAVCTHSGICARTLPSVFKPKERPWVQYENGTTEQIKSTIDLCPSVALSYTMDSDKTPETPTNSNSNTKQTEVEIIPNGPMKISNGFQQKNTDGTVSEVNNTTFYCRCGASKNEPFCDGSHTQVGFKG